MALGGFKGKKRTGSAGMGAGATAGATSGSSLRSKLQRKQSAQQMGELRKSKRTGTLSGRGSKRDEASVQKISRRSSSRSAQSKGSSRGCRSGASRTGATSSTGLRSLLQSGGMRLVVGVLLTFVALCGLAYFALLHAPFLEIKTLSAQETEHLSQEEIARLAQVNAGDNLLKVSATDISARLTENPWVESVKISKRFPHTLHITVKEKEARAIVVVKGGQEAWYVSSQGSWIQPIPFQVSQPQSVLSDEFQAAGNSDGEAREAGDKKSQNKEGKKDGAKSEYASRADETLRDEKEANKKRDDKKSRDTDDKEASDKDERSVENLPEAERERRQGVSLATPEELAKVEAGTLLGQAKAKAQAEKRVLIYEVDESLAPVVGEHVPDGGLGAALNYLSSFSDVLSSQIGIMTAPNKSSVTAQLSNGVLLALGAPANKDDIALKESVILSLLKEHESEITYINVRVPSQPAWRGLSIKPGKQE